MSRTKKPSEYVALQARVDQLHGALVTLILWMVQSAVSPIREDEARRLIDMADGRVQTKARQP